MSYYIHLQSVASTNNYLKDLLSAEDVEEYTVVYTDMQTCGRGQQNNNWESEDGKNILFSMVVFPQFVRAGKQFVISQIASLAVKDTLSEYVDNITIKWPNDIYWNEKKICGILIENSLIDDSILHSVIGIGVNINQEIFRSNAPNPVSLKQITNKTYDTKTILDAIAKRIRLYFNDLRSGNSTSIVSKYKQSLFRRDGYHLFNDGKQNFKAKIEDIEPSGILVLKTDSGKCHRFAFKEVKFVL